MTTTFTAENEWKPPGKNCGACGYASCEEFLLKLTSGSTQLKMCPFYVEPLISENKLNDKCASVYNTKNYSGIDVIGQKYDFVILPLPNEPSARKIVLPFRPDMVDIMNIVPGDIVTGRPAGAGCPVQHVIKVISSDRITGVIEGHVVGPSYSRGKDVKDVRMYHMLGFEGSVKTITKEPKFGKRESFLPGFCMMDRAHTGLVNMVIKKPYGLHIRIEDVIIL